MYKDLSKFIKTTDSAIDEQTPKESTLPENKLFSMMKQQFKSINQTDSAEQNPKTPSKEKHVQIKDESNLGSQVSFSSRGDPKINPFSPLNAMTFSFKHKKKKKKLEESEINERECEMVFYNLHLNKVEWRLKNMETLLHYDQEKQLVWVLG